MRADLLLRENINTLLFKRRHDQKDLAFYAGKSSGWISKALAGHRAFRVRDLDVIADFFGLRVWELFAPGISPLTERRRLERRKTERRLTKERRKPR